MTPGIARHGVATSAVLFALVLASTIQSHGQATPGPAAPGPVRTQGAEATPAPPGALIRQYCLGCHNDAVRAGGLALSALNLDAVHESAELAEKVIRKLRAGMMPPPAAPRPDRPAMVALISWLEDELDARAPDLGPGRVALRRLNRREYTYAIRDLIGFNVDAELLLPQDNVDGHFDTNATALQVSPSFIDQYIHAARTVAAEAVGNPHARPVTTTYGNLANMVISLPPSGAPGTGRQQHRLEGMPFGTRGGFSVEHNFPADGEYELTIGDMAMAREVPRMEFENTVIVLLDGREVYRTTIGGEADHKAIDQRLDPAVEEINNRLRRIRFHAPAGQHRLAVTFVHRSYAESDERIRTQALEGGQERIQAAHALQIRGPLSFTGMSDSASRQKIFICQPASAADEASCARQIVEHLARRAFRRPVTEEDVAPLVAFYESGRAADGFEAGVRDALSAILASPHFLYRVESGDAVNGTRTLNDLELASRLSFFLWSSLPDEELLDLAVASRLGDPGVLAAQVRRMLADPRAASLVDDFAFQWLDIAKLDEIRPDRAQFPHASGLLDIRPLLRQELRLFVDSVLRPAANGRNGAPEAADRSVVDLLTADHTFLNERLAMHYGIQTVKGAHFRRVTLEQSARHGLLGKGAILTLTAYPNRTSPVLRGAWILERLLGSPPSDPPLDVPSLPENRRDQPAQTLRERLEQHRANPTCFSCHGVMDPLGLALENFSAVGQYREHDPDTLTLIDVVGQLPDGTPITGPDDLRDAVLAPTGLFVEAFTENLLSYALGRHVDYRDMPTIRQIVRRAAADDYRFTSIVLGIVSSDAFRKRETPNVNLAAAERPSSAGGL
jgi:hypothetical protein